MDTLQKIPASKRFFRSLKILFFNTILFPFRYKKSTAFLNHIYELEPLPPLHDKIKEITLDEIFPDIYKHQIILRDLESKYGSMMLEEIYSVAALVKQLNPGTIFEFGTFIGVTTLQMSLNSGGQTVIYTLNLPSAETDTRYSIGHTDEEINLPSLQPGNRFKESEFAGKITQLYGDSAIFDFSDYSSKIDFILVDASHEYNYVKNDTEKSMKMIKPGGTIIWHDYPNAPGVYNYLNEIASEYELYHIKNTHLAFTLNFEKKKE